MLLTTTIGLHASGGDGFGRGESELKCDSTFGGGDVFPGSLGAIVDLVKWVEAEVLAGGRAIRWYGLLARLHGVCSSVDECFTVGWRVSLDS